jgi:hypothetical protein
MEAEEIRTAITFDRHFPERGFEQIGVPERKT